MDFSEPHATLPMNNPTSPTRYTWQSDPLTDGQKYRFVVRVATAAWPEGFETSNADAHTSIPDSSTPGIPTLTGGVI